jgi:hypothetical protein
VLPSNSETKFKATAHTHYVMKTEGVTEIQFRHSSPRHSVAHACRFTLRHPRAWCSPLISIQCRGEEWWSYTSTPPICLYGTVLNYTVKYRDNFTFTHWIKSRAGPGAGVGAAKQKTTLALNGNQTPIPLSSIPQPSHLPSELFQFNQFPRSRGRALSVYSTCPPSVY